MGLQSADVDAVAQLALVGAHHLHLGGLADEHGTRLYLAVAQNVDEPAHPEATDLLVIGEGNVQRSLDLAGEKLRRESETHRKEALHVGGAPPVEAAVALPYLEGIAVPGLALDRHHIGMAGERDAGTLRRAERGVQVRLATSLVVDELGGDAEVVEVPGNKLDEREVRAFAHRVERDQPADQIQRPSPRLLPGFESQCVRHA